MKRRHLSSFLSVPVFFLTFVVYLSALQNEFIQWDDDLYIFGNPHIRSLDAAFFKWAFFDFYAGNWHPLTWISHALDYAVWGLNPLGHHLTNIILHALNALVVVVLAAKLLESAVYVSRPSGEKYGTFPNDPGKRPDFPSGKNSSPIKAAPPPSLKMRGRRESYDSAGEGGDEWGREKKDRALTVHDSHFSLIAAATAGLLFGLHPLHVESVAWASERKDLLCALFFLLSVTAYMKYPSPSLKGGEVVDPLPSVEKGEGRGKWYVLSLFLFILALLSKPMAVTLPVVLLILDWYPSGRIGTLRGLWTALAEKLPFFALSLGSAVLTVFAQGAGGAIKSIEFAPLSTRVLVGFKSLIAYLWKMIWPVDLIPFYPYPKEASPGSPEYLAAIALVLGITAACVVVAKKHRLWLSVWGYYVITLIPVLGIVQVGLQSMADRYTYLPSLGPFLLMGLFAAWAWARITEKWGRRATYLAVTAFVVAIISLSYLTFRQTGIWRDSIVLWSYVIEREPERVLLAYLNRGIAFEKTGQIDRAIEDYDRAIAIDPLYYEAYNNRGVLYGQEGKFDLAIEYFNKSIGINPDNEEAYVDRGIAYALSGRHDRALEDFNRAIQLNQNSAEAYYNRGSLHLRTGDKDLALTDFQKACDLGKEDGCVRSALREASGNP
jgi:regulator of sirC expression with transglutaminase-like and TPR domain